MSFKFRTSFPLLRAALLCAALGFGTAVSAADAPAARASAADAASPSPAVNTSASAAAPSATGGAMLVQAPSAAGATAAPAASAAAAAPVSSDPSSSDFKTLDQEVQGLKKDVIDLNKDLFVLEEDLLFPANTQVAVFLSMDVGSFFALDSVTIKIDNKEVTNYLYTAREAEALLKGGVHRVYLGNLKVGKHEIVGFFTGKGPHERDYKRGATVKFDKGVGAKYLEFKISDKVPSHQPEFLVKDWE